MPLSRSTLLLLATLLPGPAHSAGESAPTGTLRPSQFAGWDHEWYSVDLELTTNLLVVGSSQSNSLGDPSVFIYRRSGASWALEQSIGLNERRRFGYDVAVADSEDLVFVGAPGDAGGEYGAVFIYQHSPATGWQFAGKILAPDGTSLDQFGGTVEVSGDNLAVAAYRTDDPFFDSGSIYMYRRQANGDWLQVDKLTIPDARQSDLFGQQIAIEGDLLVASSATADFNQNTSQGAAYTFVRDPATGDWNYTGRLTAFDGSPSDFFGSDLALSGDLLAVGAYGRDVPARDGFRSDQGSVYVYRRDPSMPSGWKFLQLLKASDGAAGRWFGRSVAWDGQMLLVGAAPFSGLGGAYAFSPNAHGIADNWRQVHAFTYPGSTTRPWFGDDVAISPHVVVVGAREDGGVSAKDGAVFLFDRAFDSSVPDHPYDQWRTNQFGAPALLDAGQRDSLWGDDADPDEDRIPNLWEFLGGSQPLVADPLSQAPSASFTGSTLTWTIPSTASAPLVPYLSIYSGDGAWERSSSAGLVAEPGQQTLSTPFPSPGADGGLFRVALEEE